MSEISKKKSHKTMLGCTFKCKPIKIHKNSSSMSGVGCSFDVSIVLFYKIILLLGGHVSRYLVSCFHVSLSQEQECDKNPSTPFSSLDIYMCMPVWYSETFSLMSSSSLSSSFCPQPSVFVLLSTKILFKNLIFKANTQELYNMEC